MWSAEELNDTALGVSASRRTDIPALFGPWFLRRLEEGFADYRPAGPPRVLRRSLRPRDVTHFTFWTRWPRPFFRALEQVLARGFPVLWNVTITGLGRSPLEPFVPATRRAVAALRELSTIVAPAAIQWRYDPVILSGRHGIAHHRDEFRRLAASIAGHVDRVAVSFLEMYGRRVAPDMRAYARETGDVVDAPGIDRKVEIAGILRDMAKEHGLELVLCCEPELRRRLGCSRAGCNSFSWAARVYPELARHGASKAAPSRTDCGCSKEVDIGAYDTCVLGCRYSYGSCNLAAARRRRRGHDPSASCLV